jgi:serine/threonine protein kinase
MLFPSPHPSDRLYGVYDETPNYYLVTEFVPGGELFASIVRRTYYSEACARRLISQVLTALHYLHTQAGVVHRDIKPENLLLTSGEPPSIILSDWYRHRRGRRSGEAC